MSSRAFLWRWNWRLLRQSWRSQLGILTMITVAVALSAGSIVAAYNLVEPPGFRYGTGDVRATIPGDAAEAVEILSTQGNPFGAIHAVTVVTPGVKDTVEARVIDPDNPVTAPLLDLVEGRFPNAADEIAVTDEAPIATRVVGEQVDLGGSMRTIVGVIENPTNLKDEYVLSHAVSSLDGFGVEEKFRLTTLLVEGDPADITFPAGTFNLGLESSEGAEVRTSVALAVAVVSAAALLMVSLLIGAAFAVQARSRARQYGLLAAAGATPRQIRGAIALGGLLLGCLATAAGVVIGLLLTAAVVPRMEETVAHRIDLSVPWWAVLPTTLLAIVAATLASWWPSRALSRQAIVEVLSSLRPRPTSTTGSSRLGAAGAVVGTVLLVVGVTRLSATIVIVGIAAALVGYLLLAPTLIRFLGLQSSRLPLPGRMAGRAIARQQGRSAAVVAALSLALAVPVGISATTASSDELNARKTLNLPDNMAIIWTPGVEGDSRVVPAEVDAGELDGIHPAIEAAVPDGVVVPLEVAIDPTGTPEAMVLPRLGPTLGITSNIGVRPANPNCAHTCNVQTLGERDADGNEILVSTHDAWLASPALLDALEVTASRSGSGVQALSRFDDATIKSHREQSGDKQPNVQFEPTIPTNPSIAPTLIWPELVDELGWSTQRVGSLLAAEAPLTQEQLAGLADAVDDTLVLESTVWPVPRSGIRAAGLAVGGLVALGLLLAALTLLSAETASDRRILQSIGAGPRTHRRLSAAMAAILAAAAAIIAVPIGYLAMVVLAADKFTDFPLVIPWLSLLVIFAAFPLMAAGMGWISSRTQTTSLARPVAGPGLARINNLVVLVVAMSVLGLGCAQSDTPQSDTPQSDTPEAQSELTFAAETIGCDERMDASFNAWVERGAAFSVVDVGGDRQCVKAYGVADRDTGRMSTTDTVYSIGSITKPLTAAGIFNLIDAGALTLDDTAGSHVKGLGGSAGASTIRDLLLHTSGIVREHGFDHVPLSKEDAIDAISQLELAFESGTKYEYANTNYSILALIIDDVTEQGYRQYIVDEILRDRNGDPLGGAGWWDGDPAAQGPRAWGYFGDHQARQRGEAPGPHWAMDGNGMMAMTAAEMAEWIYAFFTERIISPAATEQYLSTSSRLAGSGLEIPGWTDDSLTFGFRLFFTAGGGSGIGHEMIVAWVPEPQRVVVLARSASDHDIPGFELDVFAPMVVGTGIPTPPPVAAADPDQLARIVGTYSIGDGRFDLVEEDGGLLIDAIGHDAMAAVLPIPDIHLADVAATEEAALGYFDSPTLEGQRQVARLEELYGAIRDVRIIGSVWDTLLITNLMLVFDDTEVPAQVFHPVGVEPGADFVHDGELGFTTFLAYEDGVFTERFVVDGNPEISFRSTPSGLEIKSTIGAVVAERME